MQDYERCLGLGEGRSLRLRVWVVYTEWPALSPEVVETGSHHAASSREAETLRVSSLEKD